MTRRPSPPTLRPGAVVGVLGLLLAAAHVLPAEPELPARPAREGDVFETDVRPILERYCYRCHGPEKKKAGIRFDRLDPDLVEGEDGETWSAARDMLGAGDMPPAEADQPSAEERRVLVDWLNASLEEAARAHEGPPRAVLRRLTKAQYTNTLQDLLGLPIDFGRVLPDDGRSRMGFSNDGEVLLASPLHIETYQAVAREALERAIVLGERPEPIRYRVLLGAGVAARYPGTMGGTTGGYQALPLGTEDFAVQVLGADGGPREPRGADEVAQLDAVRRRISVGFRGSSQDRFHVVPEGVVLYGALPHKEVAPGAWQGPSPNMKLELQRVFPEVGDFELRVRASRGYLVLGKKELLVPLEEPRPRVELAFRSGAPGAAARLSVEPTGLGPWYRAGPVVTGTGEEAWGSTLVDPAAPLDLGQPLADGTTWVEAGEIEGAVQTYPSEIGAVWLARVLEVPSRRTLELSLGSDDALRVWLDGEEVLARDVRRGVAPDQDRLALELEPGRHRLLVQIVNHLGGFGSYQEVVHNGTREGLPPFELLAEEGALVLPADLSRERVNLGYEDGGLVAEDFPAESRARIDVELEAGYWQFDLVHRPLPPQAMGSIRFSVGDLGLDLRPTSDAEEIERGYTVTPLGAGYLNAGRHELVLGGPFFVGFTHLVLTPLGEDHPLVRRLEDAAATAEETRIPALRAFVGTRTDDGMDYRTFDEPVEVEAPLGEPRTYVFRGRLENLPIPEPESGDDEILSGILVVGVWNDHLVHSRRDSGPPLLVESLELEAPCNPVWPPESHRRVFFERPEGLADEPYTRLVLARFLERAFRRPLAEEEVEVYLAFWRNVRGEFATYEEGVREVLVAALCSPSFLFLAEEAEREDGEPLGQAALASRLSYFLWNSPPDDELRRLAREGHLRDSLAEQVDRLVDDPRFERFVRAFAREWLRMDRLEGMTINPNEFPGFTRFVKDDMAEETYRFVEYALRGDLNLYTLLDADFAMLNQNLAEFYGVEGVTGVAFRPVPVPREGPRGGLLTHGAFLAGNSDGNEPHPIKRAVWVKERLLGQPPQPPPPNVPELDPEAPGVEQLTLKERIELHRDKASCRDCHASFDPFGIALEGYDAVGRRRTERKGRPVDDATVLPDGTEVRGAEGLEAYLVDTRPEAFAGSLVKHLFAWALGRSVGYRDEPELRAIREEARRGGDRLRAVLRAVVASPSFSGR